MGLVQTAVHDAAVDAGWVGISDFMPFEGGAPFYAFGARQDFDHVTPRYCEYVRWMHSNPTVPVGLEDDNPTIPQARCGAMIAYLNQAKANNYYVGEEIPEASTLIP